MMNLLTIRHTGCVLLAVLLLGILVGCGGDAGGPASTPDSDAAANDWRSEPINFAGREFSIVGGIDFTPREGVCAGTDKFIQHIAYCEKTYNFTLKFTTQPGASYHEILSNMALSGEYAGDIWYAMTYNLTPGYARAGLVHCLDDYSVFDYSNPKWDMSVMDYCAYQGKRYGFMSAGTVDVYQNLGTGVFFNKDLFEREGLESPYDLYAQGAWTWDKMKELAMACTHDNNGDGENDQWGIGIPAGEKPFLAANNADVVMRQTDGSYRYGLNSEAGVQALEYFCEFSLLDCYAPWVSDIWSSYVTPFIEGKLGMLAYEWWICESELSGRMKEDYGWVPFPAGPVGNGYRLYRNSSNIWVIPKPVPDPASVLKMYDLISDHEDWQNDPDAYQSYVESRVRDDETLEIFGEMWSAGVNAYDMTANIDGMEGLTVEAINNVRYEGISAKTALDSIADAAQSLIDDALNT